MKRYWLSKTEAVMFSIDDLQRVGVTQWDGVRNYQARNYMMHDMNVDDEILIYHSVTDTGVYGVGRVHTRAHPDSSQFDKNDEHYDPKSSPDKPIWYCVDVAFVEKFPRFVSLEDIKADPKLEGMVVRQKGSRLSIQPVTKEHFDHIVKLAHT